VVTTVVLSDAITAEQVVSQLTLVYSKVPVTAILDVTTGWIRFSATVQYVISHSISLSMSPKPHLLKLCLWHFTTDLGTGWGHRRLR